MLAGLALSTAVPQAFGARGATFAGAYVAMQVGRTLFMLWAVRDDEARFRDFLRIAAWTTASGGLWLAGGFGPPEARPAWWAAAIAVDLVSPMVAFWTPLLGRAVTAEWDVDAGHLAERCALFVLIALGETIVVIGATVADADWDGTTASGLATTFVGSAALWWTYFDTAATNTRDAFVSSGDRGAAARLAYTYLHPVLIAGIVVTAVGYDLVLAHPHEPAGPRTLACIVGGPALFLAGNAAFRRAVHPRIPASHVAGLAMLAATATAGLHLDLRSVGLATAAILAGIATAGSVLQSRRVKARNAEG